MTEQLYQVDSYVREFDGVVTATDGQSVALDRTAFYPGGGGQPGDVGALSWEGGSARVVKVKRKGGQIWHIVDGEPPPQGATVRGELEWERRSVDAHAYGAARAVRRGVA